MFGSSLKQEIYSFCLSLFLSKKSYVIRGIVMSNVVKLIVSDSDKRITIYEIAPKEQCVFGRFGGPNNLGVKSQAVSSQHGMFFYNAGRCGYVDLGSTNGTYINGMKIDSAPKKMSREYYLDDGAVLTVGANTVNQVSIIVSMSSADLNWRCIDASSNREISVGRNSDNTIVIPNISVSRRHLIFKREGNSFSAVDCGSMNGSIINGSILKGKKQLRDGDVIKINGTAIYYTNSCFIYGIQGAVQSYTKGFFPVSENGKASDTPSEVYEIARKGGVSVKVSNVSRIVKDSKNSSGKKKILDNINVEIKPGELVAILGGSGAGKTTFMNCINGFEPATEGTVLIDGIELYKNYQVLKNRMGYVPQQDIVHENLTLKDMLMFTGKLRLPREDIKLTLEKRVNEVIDMVDLAEHKDTLISKLSGGQKKRASIAVELLSDPQLMFLDEPTSGLDPEAETSLMTQLRKLSDKGGKTVIVITHTLQNIKLFDKIIFLAPGGKLCFCGTPDEANRFFGVDNLTDAYRKILNDIDGYVGKYEKIRREA